MYYSFFVSKAIFVSQVWIYEIFKLLSMHLQPMHFQLCNWLSSSTKSNCFYNYFTTMLQLHLQVMIFSSCNLWLFSYVMMPICHMHYKWKFVILGYNRVCFYCCIYKGICSLYLGKLITHLLIYAYLAIDFNEAYLHMN